MKIFQKNSLKTMIKISLLTLTVLILFAPDSFAGTGGSEWAKLKEMLISMTTGTPAYIFCLSWIVLGAAKVFMGSFSQLIYAVIASFVVVISSTVATSTVTALI